MILNLAVASFSKYRLAYWLALFLVSGGSQWIFLLALLAEQNIRQRQSLSIIVDQYSVDNFYCTHLYEVQFIHDQKGRAFWIWRDQLSIRDWRRLSRLVLSKPDRAQSVSNQGLDRDNRR